MNANMMELMESIGLSDGYHIPIANAENMKLEAEVQKLVKAKAKAAAKLETLSEKCTGLEKHMKFARLEQVECQHLLLARNSQLESEQHMYTVSKMERERLNQELRKFTNDLKKIEEQKQNKCSDLNSLIARMDKLKVAVQWDERTIDDLTETLLSKAGDVDTIQKFSKEDERRAREMELKRLRLREEEIARRQLVSRTANEIESMRLALGRSVQIYKEMHDERTRMICQWQESVNQLRRRDKDILATFREAANTYDLNQTKLEALEEQNYFFRMEQNNNKELEATIEIQTTEVARLKNQLTKCTQQVQEYTIELNGMKRELRHLANQLESERVRAKNMLKELDNKHITLKNSNEKNDELRQQVETTCLSSMTAGERMRQLELIIQTEENMSKALMFDIEKMQGVFFRSQQALAELINTCKLKEMSIKGYETTLSTLQKHAIQEQADLQANEEALYKLDYRLNMIEYKICRMQGEHSDDDMEANLARMSELDKIASEVTDTSNLLQTQINRQEDDMRRLAAGLSADSEKLEELKDRLQNQMLLLDGAIKQVNMFKNQTNQRQVEENVLKVRVKHAERTLHHEGGHIYNVQKQRLELESAMKERQAEISVNRDLLTSNKRSLQEDNGRLRMDIQGRRLKVDHLKKRHDCVIATLGKSEDGEALSVTYFKVKNAQEKYMLQEEGDKLDSEIRKAEQEIIAMENTLKVVNKTNDRYKKSLSLIEDDSSELAEMKEVEDRLYDVTKGMRESRNELLQRSSKLQEIHDLLEQAMQVKDMVNSELEVKGDVHQELLKDTELRQVRIDRQDKQLKKLLEKQTVEETKEKDLNIRQLLEVNKAALQQLSEISAKHLETAPVITRYLTEHELKLPSNVGSHSTGRSSACSGSSTSS